MSNKLPKNRWDTKDSKHLFHAILELETVDEAKRFFRDLLTENEIIEFSRRWRVARLLSRGTPYTKIEAATGMSSTTIARIHRWLKSGMGGYRSMIIKLKRSEQ
ncbi:hypothetical protein HYW67_04065 [Candidatus Parcubacteria bacterium]|nr:hypothetical protein [Candidatus Parcubacteria bacterium]